MGFRNFYIDTSFQKTQKTKIGNPSNILSYYIVFVDKYINNIQLFLFLTEEEKQQKSQGFHELCEELNLLERSITIAFKIVLLLGNQQYYFKIGIDKIIL